MPQTLGFKEFWSCWLQQRREEQWGTIRSNLAMVWCMKTVLKIELPGCSTPAQGGWEEEHKRDEQWSPVDLHTKEHHHLIHMGATSFGGHSALHHYNKSGVLPSPCSQVSFDTAIPESFRGFQIPSFQASLKIAEGPWSMPLRQSEKFGKEVLQKYLLCEHPSAGLHRNWTKWPRGKSETKASNWTHN